MRVRLDDKIYIIPEDVWDRIGRKMVMPFVEEVVLDSTPSLAEFMPWLVENDFVSAVDEVDRRCLRTNLVLAKPVSAIIDWVEEQWDLYAAGEGKEDSNYIQDFNKKGLLVCLKNLRRLFAALKENEDVEIIAGLVEYTYEELQIPGIGPKTLGLIVDFLKNHHYLYLGMDLSEEEWDYFENENLFAPVPPPSTT